MAQYSITFKLIRAQLQSSYKSMLLNIREFLSLHILVNKFIAADIYNKTVKSFR